MAVKKLSPFDFINSICSREKTDLMAEDPENAKSYAAYIINRTLSYHNDTVLLSNEMNRAHFLDAQMQYDFYRHAVRPRRRFAKWVKPTKDEDVAVVALFYQISKRIAEDMMDLVTEADIAAMKEHLDTGGIVK